MLINADYNLSGVVNFRHCPHSLPVDPPRYSRMRPPWSGRTTLVYVNRIVINPTAKTIANASAMALFNVTRTSKRRGGGVIFFIRRFRHLRRHHDGKIIRVGGDVRHARWRV